MAWTLPWKQANNNQNPWSNKPDNQQGPPDLDEAFKKVTDFFKGGKGGGTGGGTGNAGPGFALGFGTIAAILLVLWALSGIFIVGPAEQGVVMRFGKYLKTVNPGPHWIPRFIDSKEVINVDEIQTTNLDTQMFTSGENLVSVQLVIQYRIGDVEDYLFNVVNPRSSLSQIVDSAVRQVVGHSTLDEVLTTGRAKIRDEIRKEIDSLLKRYQPGLIITDVTMQPAKAPEAVKSAFDDVIKAREDKVRLENEATSYANRVEPVAQGKAARIMQEANAYKEQVIFRATGDLAKFNAILPQYVKAPVVTKERMYYDTMQSVLGHSKVIVVDGKKNGNMFYLPLDQMMKSTSQPVLKQMHNTVAPAEPVAQTSSSSNTLSRHAYTRWLEAQQ